MPTRSHRRLVVWGVLSSRAGGTTSSSAAVERWRVPQDLTLLQTAERLLKAVDEEVTRLSAQDPWKQTIPFLMPLPAFALVTRMTLLAAIGDLTRFPSATKVVGYSGRGARVQACGPTQRTGPLTKHGRRELRTVVGEAAWTAVDPHPHWRAAFERLVPSVGKGKASVAIARKLLVVVWQVLTKQVGDCHADVAMLTRTLQRWGKPHGLATQLGLSSCAFAPQHRHRLGLDPPGKADAETSLGSEQAPAQAARSTER